MTDYFCGLSDSNNTVVIRFNGGAQAGHTVWLNNKKHVFSHFGSGTLRGFDTYLAEKFIVNPILFRMEAEQLGGVLRGSSVYVDPRCIVTTPLDMLANQIFARHSNSKASCGVGIFTTQRRHEVIPLFVEDLRYNNIGATLVKICKYYLDLFEANWIQLTEGELVLMKADISFAFSRDIDYFNRHTSIAEERVIASRYDTFIFEGAQGLMLSEKHGLMPYCTPSDPGLTWPAGFCGRHQIEEATAYYVTRAYTTRHGAGPLKNECVAADLGLQTAGETNVFNESQGRFRYAPLDLTTLALAVWGDYDTVLFEDGDVTKWSPKIVVTCLDQLSPRHAKEVLFDISMNVRKPAYISYGPSASDVICYG